MTCTTICRTTPGIRLSPEHYAEDVLETIVFAELDVAGAAACLP